jgi:hypothetical protein
VIVYAKNSEIAAAYEKQPRVKVIIGIANLTKHMKTVVELRGSLQHTAILALGDLDADELSAFEAIGVKSSVIHVDVAAAEDRVLITGWLAAWFGADLFRKHFWNMTEGNLMRYGRLMSSMLNLLVTEMLNQRKVAVSA